MNALIHSRRLWDAAMHTALAAISLIVAFQLRFEFAVPATCVELMETALWLLLITKTPVFAAAGLHRSVRRFAGLPDACRLGAANTAASLVFGVAVLVWIGPAFPRSVLLIDLLLCSLATALFHFWERTLSEVFARRPAGRARKPVLIYGAGVAGTTLLREIHSSRSLGYDVIGFLDDDPDKHGALVFGVPVLGNGRKAASIVDRLGKKGLRIREIIIAMPRAAGARMREAIANCRSARVECKTIPGVRELLDGKFFSAQIREPSAENLLGREPVRLDEAPIRASIEGRAILITGAAGSIGSELCRQVAQYRPARLVALDQAESELFKIDNELRHSIPGVNVVAAVGDVRNPDRLMEVIRKHGIESVFHAAAYKHVPMMERDVLEAVHNNVLGTWNLVEAVRELRVPKLLLISSDKAVNPSSVMGATKRVCELIVSAVPENRRGVIRCVSVRFGNVLGSNGSVVPIFRDQIAAGGPVTVTHPVMRRYFMTTSEAVTLVLQASTMGKGAEVFVLDMGPPIKILDLATNMIRQAGMVPDEDIDIRFTGLRPGEKLSEEINLAGERILPTYHEKIRIFRDDTPDWASVVEWIEHLKELLAARQDQAILAHIRKLSPEYRPSVVHTTGERLMAAAGERS